MTFHVHQGTPAQEDAIACYASADDVDTDQVLVGLLDILDLPTLRTGCIRTHHTPNQSKNWPRVTSTHGR